jgi:hypothetical protein
MHNLDLDILLQFFLLAQKLIEKNKNFDLNNILQASLIFRKKNHFSEKVIDNI